MKIALQIKEVPTIGTWSTHLYLTKAIPFFQRENKSVHIVRNGTVYFQAGKYSHTALGLWCGNTGFIDSKRKTKMIDSFPKDSELCQACEIKFKVRAAKISQQLKAKGILK